MRPDKPRHKGSRQSTQKRRYQPEVPNLGAFGMSVYRTVAGQQLSGATEAFEIATERVTSDPRANGVAFNALTLLERSEVKRQRAMLGRVPIKAAIDGVFEDVPSLRKPIEVALGGIGIFGNHKASFVSLGYRVVGESLEAARQERLDIINSMESLSEVDEYARTFDWDHRSRPHITLGRVPTALLRDPVTANPVFDALRQAMPDVVTVHRATLLDPTTSHHIHMIA